ncbi:hypothetical protein GCM10027519_20240 [Kineococcus endophyticus]
MAGGPGDLLAVVPYRLGFHPADSVLLVELRRADPVTGRRTVGLLVRGDLPPVVAGEVDPAAAHAAAEACLRLVRRSARAGSEVLVVLYDSSARLSGAALEPGPAAEAVLSAVRSGRRAGRARLGDQLLVGAGRWRTLSCAGPCCPPAGEPFAGGAVGPEVTGSAVRLQAEAVWRGFAAAPDRASSLPTAAPVDPDRCAAAAAARREPVTPARARALVGEFDRAVEQVVQGATGRGRRGGPEDSPVDDPAWCGRLLRALDRLEVRDAVLLSGCRGPSTAPARRHLLRSPGAADSAVGVVHVGRALSGETDPARAAAAAGLAARVARCGGTDGAAQAWAVAAWLEWTAGRSAPAGACAEQALREDPDHRLAALVDHTVRRGLGPAGESGPEVGADAPPGSTGAGGVRRA